MEERIIKLLMDRFESVYCDNCNAKNCDDCIRKSMGWSLSYSGAREIAREILELGESNLQILKEGLLSAT